MATSANILLQLVDSTVLSCTLPNTGSFGITFQEECYSVAEYLLVQPVITRYLLENKANYGTAAKVAGWIAGMLIKTRYLDSYTAVFLLFFYSEYSR